MSGRGRPGVILTLNTLAFTACFAVWVMNGVLVTFLVENHVFQFDKAQIGWLLGTPILTGSVFRLPVGLLTDRFGGRVVFPLVACTAYSACVSAQLTRIIPVTAEQTILCGLTVASLVFSVDSFSKRTIAASQNIKLESAAHNAHTSFDV